MSRSYWLSFFTVGLIVAALSAIWAFQSFREYQNEHTQQRQSVASYQTETSEDYSSGCFKKGVAFSDSIKCLINSIDANREAQRSKYDLQAQQEMAEWAYAIALLTIVSTVIGAIGLVALFASLFQTRTSIKDNREMGEAQTRAYLTASGGTYRIERHGIYFQPRFRNTGSSPAKRITTKSKLIVILKRPTPNSDGKEWASQEFEGSYDDVGSGREDSGMASLPAKDVPAEVVPKIHAGKNAWLVGSVSWFDVFKKEQTATFAFACKKARWEKADGERIFIGPLHPVMNKDIK
jgi:hypothetical protein